MILALTFMDQPVKMNEAKFEFRKKLLLRAILGILRLSGF